MFDDYFDYDPPYEGMGESCFGCMEHGRSDCPQHGNNDEESEED